MTTEELSLEKSQSSAELNRNYHSFKRVGVEGTPFTEIYEEGKGWYLVMGDYRMTEEHESQLELQAFVKDNMWNIMLVMCSIVSAKQIEENNKLQGETK